MLTGLCLNTALVWLHNKDTREATLKADEARKEWLLRRSEERQNLKANLAPSAEVKTMLRPQLPLTNAK